MTRVICDQCRKEVEPGPYGLAPDGWFSIDERGRYTARKDLCSVPCVVAAYTPRLTPDVERTPSDPAFDMAARDAAAVSA